VPSENSSPTISPIGPVGPCSPGIQRGRTNVRGLACPSANTSVAWKTPRGASVRSTVSVTLPADSVSARPLAGGACAVRGDAARGEQDEGEGSAWSGETSRRA
jgi:hypothetical protein